MKDLELLRRIGIMPVVRIDAVEHGVPLAKALQKGGLPAAEITLRSAAALDSIRAITATLPDFYVCAGTVLTPEQAQNAVEAGAKAIISPGLNLATIRWCKDNGILVIPGCATPSEVEAAMREGLNLVKLFPAQIVGGLGMLKALSGPYASMHFMPTGGINPANVKDYLSQKNVLACGGTWIVPEDVLAVGNFEKIEALALEASALTDVKS